MTNDSCLSVHDSSSPDKAFHIVGVGASTGGLEALEALFNAVPTDSGMAFVVVQHLSPDLKSHMAELLARQTSIPIHRVEHATRVVANSIFLIPANKEMVISSGWLLLAERSADRSLSHPIDRFFQSLASDSGPLAVGVILSGTGSDGARGVQQIHDAGGLVIAQDEATARFDGTPVSAIATGKVDLVLPPPAIAAALLRYTKDGSHLAGNRTNFGGNRRVQIENTHIQQMPKALAQTYENKLLYSQENLQLKIEELLASNRELQSKNEKLITVNEELYTVNAEHQRRIEQLVQANDDIDNRLATTRVGVIFLDDGLYIRRFTPEIARVFRLGAHDTGRSIEQFSSRLNRPCLIDDLHEVLHTQAKKEMKVEDRFGNPYLLRIMPYRSVDETGGLVMILMDIKSLADADGNVLHFVGVQHDVTEQMRDQQALKIANEAAGIASEAKRSFLATISHELRTPMTAVLGFAEMLKAESTDPDFLDKVDAIQRNGTYLLALLNDILDLSKVESGKLQFVHEDIDIRSVVAEVESLMQIRAREMKVPLRFEFTSHLPATITADTTRVRQILVNLISNALKFSDSAEVVVSTFTAFEDGKYLLKISIRDHGIGISEDYLAELFTPFNQSVRPSTVNPGGTGLGLSISKGLAEGIGGSIEVESKLGVGSCFTLCLPITTSGARRLKTHSREILRSFQHKGDSSNQNFPSINGRVLLADDRRDVWRVGKYFLEKCGADVTIVENGKQAVEAVSEAVKNENPFSLVLMDMQMPVMTGHDAVKELRKKGFDLPIIALTADAMEGEREACIEMGCNEYFPKPIDGPRLMNSIAELIKDYQGG